MNYDSTGRFLTPWEKRLQEEAELERHLKERASQPAYKVPDSVLNDWTGEKYTSTHKCFGKPCDPEELKQGKYVPVYDSFVQMDQPYGDYERERDEQAGHPKDVETDGDFVKAVDRYIDPKSGRMRT